MKAKKITVLALSVALSMVFSFVESQIPPLVAVPGVKIGLANIVTVFLLYRASPLSAAAVSLVRVVLSSLLFGSVLTLLYSLAGAVLSFVFMLLLKRIDRFSTLGVSVVGGVMHNVGQIICAAFVMESAEIVSYLPILIISGTLAGVAVGAAGGIVVKRIEKI